MSGTNVSKCQVQMLITDNNKTKSNICYNDNYYQKKIIGQNLISFNLPPNWKNRYDKQVLGWFWVFGMFLSIFFINFYLKTYSIFNWNIILFIRFRFRFNFITWCIFIYFCILNIMMQMHIHHMMHILMHILNQMH